jgi:hypothetical protein
MQSKENLKSPFKWNLKGLFWHKLLGSSRTPKGSARVSFMVFYMLLLESIYYLVLVDV